MAIIGYIIFFVPLLMPKRSQFLSYHANQALVLFIFAVALQIVLSFFLAIPFIGLILQIVRLLPLLLVIMGIMNASSGQMKPLPLIGGFTIIK